MKVIKLSFLFITIFKYIDAQFNNAFNSAYSSNLLKKQPNSFNSFYFLNGNNQARTETPVASRYNLTPTVQTQQPNNNTMQTVNQLRQQFGVNYSSPASRVQFTPTSQQQIPNSQFLTANDITSQNVPQPQNSIQYSLRNQAENFNALPQRGEVLIGQPQNFSQQIQNQNLQNQIKPEAFSLANQLSFSFNSTQAQQDLLNQQLAQAQAQQQGQVIQPTIPQVQNENQSLQIASQIQQPQQNDGQNDTLALLQQIQNLQSNGGQQQPQTQNTPGTGLTPEQQQLQMLLKQLQLQPNQQNIQPSQQIQQDDLIDQPVDYRQQARNRNQQQTKRNLPQEEEEDILSQFFDQQEEGDLDSFFGVEEEPVQQPTQKKRRPPARQNVDPEPDPPKQEPKKSSSSAGDINLFELFNNQGSSNSIGNSELQGEVVHYIDDPSQLNSSSEPEITSIDQMLAAGEIPGGGGGGPMGMPF